MDLISSNLQATNAKYNSILSKLESTKSDALSNLETAASTATSAISAQLANVTSELRTLVPEGLSVPNINLQAQLQSLSGLTDVTQSANLLSSISTNFGSALTAGGFDLDSLVSSASDAVSSGTSLSGLIPNFEMSADGLGDAIQKASGVKLPDIDPVIEEVATFTDNSDFTAAKTAATNAVHTTYDTLPTQDVGPYKISDKSKKVTQSQGGVSVTKEVTTPIQAVETTVSGGVETVKRSNVSPNGFSSRSRYCIDKFKLSDLVTVGSDIKVTLTNKPYKLKHVNGWVENKEATGKMANGNPRYQGKFRIINARPYMQRPNYKYKNDTFSVDSTNPKEITITQLYRKYDKEEGTCIRISYWGNVPYDPTYA